MGMNQSLVTAFSGSVPDGSSRRYWLRMEQEKQSDIATYKDVAEMVDSLYDIDPCTQKVTVVGEVKEPPAAPTRQKLYESFSALMADKLAACNQNATGGYEAWLRVYRSHIDEPYNFALFEGEVVKKIRTAEPVNKALDVNKQDRISLEYSVVDEKPMAEWQGPVFGLRAQIDPPEILFVNGELVWGVIATGTILVSFSSEYDRLTLQIPGDAEGESQQAEAIVTYASMLTTKTIEPPDDDPADEVTNFCDWNYKNGSTDVESEPVPDLPPDDDSEYGCIDYAYSFASPNVYKQFCCIDNDNPYYCNLRAEPNPGGAEMSQADIDKYTSPTTEFIPVQPDDSRGCGTTFYRLHVAKNSCCEDVPPLVFDMESTPDILPHGKSIIVYWDGSDGQEVTVTTSSNGTYFSDGRKTSISYGDSIELFANETFCGSTAVTVTDGCSVATIQIRSDLGSWRYVGAICLLPDVEDQNVSFVNWQAVVGNIKQIEGVSYLQDIIQYYHFDNCGELPDLCGDPGNTCLALSDLHNNCQSILQGAYKCSKSGLTQRRDDPYGNHGYLSFETTTLSAYKWSCQ